MAKRRTKAKEEVGWIVRMRVERNITVYVYASDEDQARTKASEWDIDGDEEPGDTINWEITCVELND